MDEQDLLDSTLIVFTSDHGEFLGDYNCFGKRSFLDSSARIPLVMKYPGLEQGLKIEQPVSLVDLMPTFLNYAGIKTEGSYDGVDLKEVVENTCERKMIYGQYEAGNYANYMATDGRYKYIYSAPDQKEFLFDLLTDPEETRNKAKNPLFVKKTDEMRQETIGYYLEEGYTSDIHEGEWKQYPIKTMPQDSDAYLLFQDRVDSLPHIPGYETDANERKNFEFKWFR